MPQSPLLVDFAVALPISVGIAYLLARLILAIFGRRLSLSITAMTLISLLGFSVGIFLAGMFLYGQRLWMPTTLLLTFGTSLGLSFLVASIVALTQRGVGDADISALLRAGESERAEFKETARWNVRESKKDARMELAIAKTIAAFLNSRGGVLVIGANDAGQAVGLDRDLATLRTPTTIASSCGFATCSPRRSVGTPRRCRASGSLMFPRRGRSSARWSAPRRRSPCSSQEVGVVRRRSSGSAWATPPGRCRSMRPWSTFSATGARRSRRS